MKQYYLWGKTQDKTPLIPTSILTKKKKKVHEKKKSHTRSKKPKKEKVKIKLVNLAKLNLKNQITIKFILYHKLI